VKRPPEFPGAAFLIRRLAILRACRPVRFDKLQNGPDQRLPPAAPGPFSWKEGRAGSIQPGELCYPCRRVRAVSAGPRLPDPGILAKLCGDGAVISQFSTTFRGALVLSRNHGDAKSIFNELREHYAALRGYA
jgi:hypothetical protein